MLKTSSTLAVLAAVASSVLAMEIEEIGSIDADFGGQAISQPTVIATDGDESSSSAFLFLPGGGFSSLSLSGFSMDNARLGIDLTYMSETPGPDTVPIDVTITFSPEGTGQHWTSQDAPSAVTIAFTTFAAAGEAGQVIGTFHAVLCYAEGYESEPDTTNCRPIQGSFDTPIVIER